MDTNNLNDKSFDPYNTNGFLKYQNADFCYIVRPQERKVNST